MAKKKARKDRTEPRAAAPDSARRPQEAAERGVMSGKSRILWLLALSLIVLGYFLLHKVDPGGQNAWGIVSPALLLSGYLLIIPAIITTYRR
jgi:hypothetical protein